MTESGIYRKWFQSVLYGYKESYEKLSEEVNFKLADLTSLIGPLSVFGYGLFISIIVLVFEKQSCFQFIFEN